MKDLARICPEMKMSTVHTHNPSHNRILIHTRIVLKFVRHHSWLELTKRIWIAATKRLFESRSMLIMRLIPEDAAEPDPSLRIRELTLSDIDQMLAIMYLSPRDIHSRFDRSERCFAVLDGEHIRTYFWVQFGVRELDRLYLKINLEPNQAWFYNAITVKSARGRGYYPNMIRYMVSKLKAEGFEEFFIDVEERNLASIRDTEKAGCKPITRIEMKRTLSQATYKVQIFDKESWQELSKQISNFPRGERVLEEAVDGS